MSYVLEALKKSETERKLGKVPGIETFGQHGAEPMQHRGLQLWQILVVVIFTLVIISTLFYLFYARETAAPPPAYQEPENTTPIPPTPQPVPPKPQPISQNPAPSVAKPLGLQAASRIRSLSMDVEKKTYTDRFSAQVAGISSGCLIEIKRSNHFQKIQLANVSCFPPKSEAGRGARRFTTEMVFTQKVVVAVWKKGVSGPWLTDVFLPNGRLLNQELIRRGLASSSDQRFRSDEEQAHAEGSGMWQNLPAWIHAP